MPDAADLRLDFRNERLLLAQSLKEHTVVVPGGDGAENLRRDGVDLLAVHVKRQLNARKIAFDLFQQVALLVAHTEADGQRLRERRLSGRVAQLTQRFDGGELHAVGEIARHDQTGVLRLKNHLLPKLNVRFGQRHQALRRAQRGERAVFCPAEIARRAVEQIALAVRFQLAQDDLLLGGNLLRRPRYIREKAQEVFQRRVKEARQALQAEHQPLGICRGIEVRAEAVQFAQQSFAVQSAQPAEA